MGLFDRLRGRPTQADFAARLILALRKAGETCVLRYDPAEARIVRLDGGNTVGVINLVNMYGTYLAKPRPERAAYLRVCVRGAMTYARELPDDFESARPDLRPKIWSRSGIEKQRLRGRLDGMGGGPDLPSVPLGDHLLACIAYDWPDSTQSVSGADLEGWGVSVYEALEAARENLAETTEGYARIGDNVYSFVTGDSYDACRLLLTDPVRGFELSGRPVAMVPNRDSVLITGEDDEQGLALMAALATDQIEQNYRLSGVALVLDGDQWVDWMPSPGYPLLETFRTMETKFLWPEYKEQKALLDALHEREEVDLFVAPYSALEKKDGGALVSYCVWSDVVDSLLPVARKVIFVREGQEGFAALSDWERVLEVVGDLMEETDDYPRRFRVRRFPAAAALEAIGLGEL